MLNQNSSSDKTESHYFLAFGVLPEEPLAPRLTEPRLVWVTTVSSQLSSDSDSLSTEALVTAAAGAGALLLGAGV